MKARDIIKAMSNAMPGLDLEFGGDGDMGELLIEALEIACNQGLLPELATEIITEYEYD